MAAKLQWFPLYAADFVNDETVMLASNQVLGAYIRLLCHQWIEGSIPADVAQLGRLVGEDGATFGKMWLDLKRKFRAAGRGRLVNAKLEAVRKQQLTRQRGLSHAGSLAHAGLEPGRGEVEIEIEKEKTPRLHRATWVDSAAKAWADAYQGRPSFGKIGRQLKPLVDVHGWDTVARRWSRYLAETDAQYANPARFAETFGRWGDGPAESGVVTRAQAEAMFLAAGLVIPLRLPDAFTGRAAVEKAIKRERTQQERAANA